MIWEKFILQIFPHTILSLIWTKFRKRKRLNPLFATCQNMLSLFQQCLFYKSHMITTTKQKYKEGKLWTSKRCRPFSGHFLYCLTIEQPEWIWILPRTLHVSPGCVAAFCAMSYNARAQLLFCALKLLFRDVLVGVVVVVCLKMTYEHAPGRARARKGNLVNFS